MPNKVLHVEDSSDDVALIALAFRKAGVLVDIEVATDGDQAIAALQSYSSPLPRCVLLDIKLPTKTGLEVLSWIRSQSRFKRLPVLMLTSSQLPRDINDAYDLGANSYLIKPSSLEKLVLLAQTIAQYWLATNVSPVPD
jgi:CheY-like chemotaxis protein